MNENSSHIFSLTRLNRKVNLTSNKTTFVMLTIGFIVNPIAGLGGKKAWKGTDNIIAAWDFFEKGEQYSFGRVHQAFSSISSKLPLHFYFCDNPMGADLLNELFFSKEKVYVPKTNRSSAEDTKNACKVFLEKGVDLILFVGGDGTARDVTSVVGEKIPVLGIPSGVKMFSGCFLYHPRDLGEILDEMLHGDIVISPEDVMDVNEALFRENKVHAILYGQLMVPHKIGLIQGGKVSSSVSSPDEYSSISDELEEEKNILQDFVVLGTGSTVYHVMKELGIEKTLLGIDIIEDGKILAKDVDEETLFQFSKGKHIKILLTPIGGQGFLLGRGNQQISSRALKNALSFELIIISTVQKLDTIEKLEIDLDKPLDIPDVKNGFIKVLTSYHQYTMKDINVQTLG